jgi:hypothetical protein
MPCALHSAIRNFLLFHESGFNCIRAIVLPLKIKQIIIFTAELPHV